MNDRPTDVVVYCDGTPGSNQGDRTPPKPHTAHPIAAYRRIVRGWLSLAYGTFDGSEFAASSSADQMAVDGPIMRPTRQIDGREHFDVDAYEARQEDIEQRRRAGEELRSHYQWRCEMCGFHVDALAEPMHRLFSIVAAADSKVSLARVAELQKHAAKRR